ncbi:Hypothetical predicted protein [Paramuricea clavata]|uniref:Uncharacterized protein n=1 Tax=Paramuricea clavata TaxID=317549 RepID=A0A6S7I2Y1_PARCT|nr:Hypothetical predicted protein [Paramuricea clavata]
MKDTCTVPREILEFQWKSGDTHEFQDRQMLKGPPIHHVGDCLYLITDPCWHSRTTPLENCSRRKVYR